jgi:hypothetical protein
MSPIHTNPAPKAKKHQKQPKKWMEKKKSEQVFS